MAGWLHGVFVGEWLFVFPLCGFSLSLFCNSVKKAVRNVPEHILMHATYAVTCTGYIYACVVRMGSCRRTQYQHIY